jgi:hypothetical protein
MSAAQETARHPQLLDQLRRALGPDTQLVSVREADAQRWRCAPVAS